MAFVLDAGDVRDTPVPEIEQVTRRRRRPGLVVSIDTVDSLHSSRNTDHRDGLGERAQLIVGGILPWIATIDLANPERHTKIIVEPWR